MLGSSFVRASIAPKVHESAKIGPIAGTIRSSMAPKFNESAPNPSKVPSTINIDFNQSSGSKPSRKSSFLPMDFEDETKLSRTGSQFKFIFSNADAEKLEKEPSALDMDVKMKTFITGSRYIGHLNKLGMAGKGIYKYPHGVIYDGQFNKQGEFHGLGSLIYPGGQRVDGMWKNGKLSGANFVASDNSRFDSNYCEMPDRRFQIELDNEVQAAGQEYLTNDEVPRTIPPGMYDTGYGFYDPVRKVVVDYEDPEKYRNLFEMMDDERKLLYQRLEMEVANEETSLIVDVSDESRTQMVDNLMLHIVAIPPEEKEKWVKNNCRKPGDENIGYRPDLYEVWNPGYARDDYQVSQELAKLSAIKVNTALVKKFSKPKGKATHLYSFTRAKIRSQVVSLEEHIEAHVNKISLRRSRQDPTSTPTSGFW
ncbi:unnamed protein product [Ceutorhynchus assimilis]|uniref:MORN repeat-containing protein 5 n=1 Tax=Ceutorhynchus assimilis TaxID=467358 RepID=A0A9N9MBB6_9CUCU|nr:unnamed protein product [Ceutorhynchus assimilis]